MTSAGHSLAHDRRFRILDAVACAVTPATISPTFPSPEGEGFRTSPKGTLKIIFGFTFDPYRAMPIFGQLITGLPSVDPLAIAFGWLYHFWNGVSFGMMFALLRPQGGPIAGLIWAMILQGLMMTIYPSFLRIRLEDPGFLTMGIVGHGLWGIVLGIGLKRGGHHA